MARYIDASLAKEMAMAKANTAKSDFERTLMTALVAFIDAFPTASVAPVVRCKDCKHCRNLPHGMCYLNTEPYDNERGYKGEAVCVEADDFCSYGERQGDSNAISRQKRPVLPQLRGEDGRRCVKLADINKGSYANWDADPRHPESWHFHPKKAATKLGYADVLQQLFDNGMEGNLYVQLYRVPDEFPGDADNDVILLNPEDALKILARWCGKEASNS